MTRIAAFFDFDGTVIDGYSAMALLKDRMRHLEIGPTEALKLSITAFEALTGQGEVEDFMRAGVSAAEFGRL